MYTFEAYVDVWLNGTAQQHFKGWAVFGQCANAKPKRLSKSPDRVKIAEQCMTAAGYTIGPSTSRGARQWTK